MTATLRLGPATVRVAPRSVRVGLVLLGSAVAVAAVTVATGPYAVPVPDVVQVLLGGGSGARRYVVLQLRLPRLTAALLVGAALGLSGAVFQSLSRNPLGSPDIIGFTSGAAAGALVAIVVLGGSVASVSTGALAGGLLTALVVYLLALRRGYSGYRLILVGIAVTAGLRALVDHLLSRAELDTAQAAQVWLYGSLNGRGWDQVAAIAAGLLVLVPVTLLLGRELALLEMGDDAARALGVRVTPVRVGLLVAAVLLCAVATAVAGPVAFVALAAPQLARRLTRSGRPDLVPAALTGALLLVAADLLAQRALAPTQVPVGLATGALGGAYLIGLLGRRRSR